MTIDLPHLLHYAWLLAAWAAEHMDQLVIAAVSILSYLHLLAPIKARLQHSNFEELVQLAYSAAAWAARTGSITNADKVAHALKKLDDYIVLFEKRAATPEDLSKAQAIFTKLHEQEAAPAVVSVSSTVTGAVAVTGPRIPAGND